MHKHTYTQEEEEKKTYFCPFARASYIQVFCCKSTRPFIGKWACNLTKEKSRMEKTEKKSDREKLFKYTLVVCSAPLLTQKRTENHPIKQYPLNSSPHAGFSVQEFSRASWLWLTYLALSSPIDEDGGYVK